ncbi:hypothetical protein ZYGR_0AK04800 [Zygosaccharomyces rouxii]|uniref:Rho-GAP domain-containing protein n=1 Tax=Zygosaccharomyces rouxii TaxID=4956 RepID=A0A1Q3AE66_ZYGRO|nr:hypothetical protein ZYGR_0AK04800 [Zygosaccharomyces rouxii]
MSTGTTNRVVPPPSPPLLSAPVANIPSRRGSFKMDEENRRLHLNANSLPIRPSLPNKAHSYTIISKGPEPNQSRDFKNHRDSFLANRNQFTGKVFGVSLSESLSIASAEVIVQSELVSFGRIPIVVAKCGAYLKANGLETSGIFRIAGNGKRIRELQSIFSSPPDYGSKFNNWDGFTVHDVASLLRRYLNNLEEPLIPLDLYEEFRAPLRDRPRILRYMANRATVRTTSQHRQPHPSHQPQQQQQQQPQPQAQTNTQFRPQTQTAHPGPQPLAHANRKNSGNEEDRENDGDGEQDEEANSAEAEERRKKKLRHKRRLIRDVRSAVKDYERLFSNISNDAKQLTIYLLDLLSLFSRQSQFNSMTARNLATIFQPSILSHPRHDLDPKEYELSRIVTEFLIEYSYDLLPHLLKMAKEEQKRKQRQNISLMIPKPQKLVVTDEENNSVTQQITPVTAESPSNKYINFPNGDADNDPDFNPNDANINNVDNDNNNNNNNNNNNINNINSPDNDGGGDVIGGVGGSWRNRPASPGFSFHTTNSIPSRATSPISPHPRNTIQIPKRPRPHSRSIGSAPVPSDVISSNRRRSRLFPFWPRPGILSDSGDLTTTEEEGDEGWGIEEENRDGLVHSPVSINSGSRQNLLSLPKFNRSFSGNSTTSSFNKRPMSMVFQDGRNNDSIDELEEATYSPQSPTSQNFRNFSGSSGGNVGSVGGSGNENPFFLQQARAASRESIDDFSDEPNSNPRNKRGSWFQKLKSRSRSGTIS